MVAGIYKALAKHWRRPIILDREAEINALRVELAYSMVQDLIWNSIKYLLVFRSSNFVVFVCSLLSGLCFNLLERLFGGYRVARARWRKTKAVGDIETNGKVSANSKTPDGKSDPSSTISKEKREEKTENIIDRHMKTVTKITSQLAGQPTTQHSAAVVNFGSSNTSEFREIKIVNAAAIAGRLRQSSFASIASVKNLSGENLLVSRASRRGESSMPALSEVSFNQSFSSNHLEVSPSRSQSRNLSSKSLPMVETQSKREMFPSANHGSQSECEPESDELKSGPREQSSSKTENQEKTSLSREKLEATPADSNGPIEIKDVENLNCVTSVKEPAFQQKPLAVSYSVVRVGNISSDFGALYIGALIILCFVSTGRARNWSGYFYTVEPIDLVAVRLPTAVVMNIVFTMLSCWAEGYLYGFSAEECRDEVMACRISLSAYVYFAVSGMAVLGPYVIADSGFIEQSPAYAAGRRLF
ncbi:hypothetical protein HDU97_005183 [Phlyctochytrium planicorne]|nr:hypothetical protein HDU97_005183 [Phlyctochytrium planicorne]